MATKEIATFQQTAKNHEMSFVRLGPNWVQILAIFKSELGPFDVSGVSICIILQCDYCLLGRGLFHEDGHKQVFVSMCQNVLQHKGPWMGEFNQHLNKKQKQKCLRPRGIGLKKTSKS